MVSLQVYHGSLWGWGCNQDGQLGNGTTITSIDPVEIMENVIFVSASAGSGPSQGHTMAITSDGTLWGWGANQDFQLGDGTRTSRFRPVEIMSDVIYVATGANHTMAITHDNKLWGWGCNRFYQMGNGTNLEYIIPAPIMENVIAVSTSSLHTMAITKDGELWAWGHNRHGQLGDGTTISRPVPVRIK